MPAVQPPAYRAKPKSNTLSPFTVHRSHFRLERRHTFYSSLGTTQRQDCTGIGFDEKGGLKRVEKKHAESLRVELEKRLNKCRIFKSPFAETTLHMRCTVMHVTTLNENFTGSFQSNALSAKGTILLKQP